MRPWLAAIGLLAGCTCGVPAVGNFSFPCSLTADCAPGYWCNSGTCADAGICTGAAVNLNCDPTLRAGPVCCPVGTGYACLDLQSDPNNCGACTIACPSGSCVGGQCSCLGACPSFVTDAGIDSQSCDAGFCFCSGGGVQCGGRNNGSCRGGFCTPGGD